MLTISNPLRPVARFVRGVALIGAVVALLGGCATPPPADDTEAVADFKQTNDPLEPANRVFYAVNDGLDTIILRPVAQAYRYVVPGQVRTGIHNVLTNLTAPVSLSNDILSAKPKRAGDTTMRFLINTTVGVLGVFDVAKDWGYPDHDADFGLTMARWGVPEGPFLFLPILGPTGPRDVTGFGVDIVLDPFTWVGTGAAVSAANWTRTGMNAVDRRERALDATDSIKKTALDPYATFRSLYRQNRQAKVEAIKNDNRATVPVWFARGSGN